MNVDLAPLKTLFPQSITFDCYCTKGKVVNIRVSFVGGGGGFGGRRKEDSFRKYCISKCETGKEIVMWNIKVTWQSAFAI